MEDSKILKIINVHLESLEEDLNKDHVEYVKALTKGQIIALNGIKKIIQECED